MSLSVQVRPWAKEVSDSAMVVYDSVGSGSEEDGSCVELDNIDVPGKCTLVVSPLRADYNESYSCNNIKRGVKVTYEEEKKIVSDVMQGILDRVEERVVDATQREPMELREIDCDGSRERGKSRNRKADTPNKVVRRKRNKSDDKKKSRRRSTSCSTTSSACSDTPRKHRRKHKHHKRKKQYDVQSPRVNPIFLWIKQDDTRIVEVLCEDYDKRNRIRLTKTAQGWRATPRTERLASALSSRSSTDTNSSAILDQPTQSLVSCKEEDVKLSKVHTETKEDDEDEEENVSAVCSPSCKPESNNSCDIVNKIENNDNDKTDKESDKRPDDTENAIDKSEVRLDCENTTVNDYIDEEMCHEDLIEEIEEIIEEDNNKISEAEDVYAFVPTPKTEEETVCKTIDKSCENFETYCKNVECIEDDDADEFSSERAEDMIEEVFEEDDDEAEEEDRELCDTVTEAGSPLNLVVDTKKRKICSKYDDHGGDDDNNNIERPVSTSEVDISSLSKILRLPEGTTLQHTLMPSSDHLSRITHELRPAHQQNKTKFLETILSCPKICHQNVNNDTANIQEEPLNLGISRKSASPTVSSSDTRKIPTPEGDEPKSKRMKTEDITLKNILNKSKDFSTRSKSEKFKDPSDDGQQAVDSTTKSRLLELLTSEPTMDDQKSDPLTQLKEVLSDPDLVVPDPLLVPRARLPALVANPAKEIPRLLSQKQEPLSYPKLLTDPDLLVVSLAHLQSLLQRPGKDEDMLKYHQQAQYLQQQFKQEQASLDAATATALNQMLWLPYLSQLEAAALACGNNQEFLAMLNLVFPPSGYPHNSYFMPHIPPVDYKTQLEFNQALALWQESMMQSSNIPSTQNLNNNNIHSNNNNNISHKSHSYFETKYNPKTSVGQMKQTSARTSPIAMNYHQRHRPNSHQYSSAVLNNQTMAQQGTSYRSHQAYQKSLYNNYTSTYRPSSVQHLPTPKTEPLRPPSTNEISSTELNRAAVKLDAGCKPSINLLSKSRSFCNVEMKNSNKIQPCLQIPSPTTRTEKLASPSVPVDLSAHRKDPEVPKLKVKQHLVDPNVRPKLLKFEDHPEVVSTTGTPHVVDETHPHLWHPLFSSHQQKSYTSPWQWTTPVTVSGE